MSAAQGVGREGPVGVHVIVSCPPQRLILCPQPLQVQVDGRELKQGVLLLGAALHGRAFVDTRSQSVASALELDVPGGTVERRY